MFNIWLPFPFPNNNILMHLRGNCTPNQNLVCFVCYLKIINIVLKIILTSWSQVVLENAIFEFLRHFWMLHLFLEKVLICLRQPTKHDKFWFGVKLPQHFPYFFFPFKCIQFFHKVNLPSIVEVKYRHGNLEVWRIVSHSCVHALNRITDLLLTLLSDRACGQALS